MPAMNRDAMKVPQSLGRRARTFVEIHGVRLDPNPLERYRRRWRKAGVPDAQIDRAVEFEARWGGLVLPPAPHYEGGPGILGGDLPEGSADEGWWFPAGVARYSMAYGFMIGPSNEFGIHSDEWTPLHGSVEGWVESLALAYHAAYFATSIRRLRGAAVDGLDLNGYKKIAEVDGLADTWWQGPDSLIAIYGGEAACLSKPVYRTAVIYSGVRT